MLVFAALTAGQPATGSTGYRSGPDEMLIVRIARGDRTAFEDLYEETSNAVFAYALSLLHRREDAEDVMQDTFLKVRAAAHLYRPQGKPMAWVLTITRNLCLMRFRQGQRRADLPPEDQPGRILEDLGTDRISEAEDRLLLETAFRVLSPEELRVIILHAVSGLRHREIAEAFGIPVSTVLSRYNRGLKKLRSQLEE